MEKDKDKKLKKEELLKQKNELKKSLIALENKLKGLKPSDAEIKEAEERISKLTNEAEEKIREAEKIADEFGLEINFSVAYGMGGTYYPKKNSWDESFDSDNSDDSEGEWRSSSSSC